MYLAGRILFLPLYAIGALWLKTLGGHLATLGVVLVGAQASSMLEFMVTR